MKPKWIYISSAVLLIVLAGCASVDIDGAFPEPRPLGSGLVEEPGRPPAGGAPGPAFDETEPADTLTISRALSLALLGNPTLAAYSWERRAREAHVLQARLFPNPELEIEIENVDGGAPGGAFSVAEVTILLSQLLETGGKRAKRARYAALEAARAGWDYEAKRLDILTETATAFVDVLAAQERVLLAEETHRLSDEMFSVVSARVEAGKATPLDTAKASVERSLNIIRVEKEYRNLEAARKRLASFWGAASPRFARAAGELAVSDTLPPGDLLDNLVGQSPDVARWNTEIEHRRAALSLAKAGRFPDLTLGAGIRLFEETDDQMLVFGFSVPVPLFDRNQGNVREAEYLLARAKEEARGSAVAAGVRLAGALGALQSAHSEVFTLRNAALPAASQAIEAAREGYRRGKFGLKDVLDAQETFTEVRYRYIEAFVEYHGALTAVERLIGQDMGRIGQEDANH